MLQILISFIIGYLFWYLAEYFADYNSNYTNNLVMVVYMLTLISFILTKFLDNNLMIALGLSLGQITFLLQDYFRNNSSVIVKETFFLVPALMTLLTFFLVFAINPNNISEHILPGSTHVKI